MLLPALLKTALDFGVDAVSILSRNGIEFDALDLASDRINADQFACAVSDIIEATHNPTIGISYAKHYSYDYVNEIGTYLLAADRLIDGFRAFRWISELTGPFVSINYGTEGEVFEAKVSFVPGSPEVLQRLFVESSFSMINQFGLQRAGQQFHIHSIGFAHHDKAALPVYRNVFQCPVTLGTDCYVMRFDKAMLDTPLAQSSPALKALSQDQILKRLESEAGQKGFAQRVHDLLLRHPYIIERGIDELATRLNISRRTLQRRFAKEGVRYSAVVEGVRKILALQYLEEGRLNIEQVSDLLGFSERRSFSRAFQGWFGVSPSKYRRVL